MAYPKRSTSSTGGGNGTNSLTLSSDGLSVVSNGASIMIGRIAAAKIVPTSPLTIPVKEGDTLKVKGAAGSSGVVNLLGAGGVTVQSWAVGLVDFWLPALTGTQTYQVICTAGSIDAAVVDAVLGVPKFDPAKPHLLTRPDGSSVRFTGRHGNSLGVIGDSRDDISFSEGLTGTDPGNFSQPAGCLKWALGRAGHPFLRTSDFARGGSGCTSTTADVHPTYQEQLAGVLADMPSYCWVRTPINDFLRAPAQTADQVFDKFSAIVDALFAAGIQVFLLTCSTQAPNFNSGYNVIAQQEILKLNAKVRAKYGTGRISGVTVIDIAHIACKPGDTAFNAIDYSYKDKDAVHKSNVGAWLEGEVIANTWIEMGLKPLPLLTEHAGDAYRNVAANNDTPGTVLNSGSNNIFPNGTFELGAPVNGLAQGWKENAKGNVTVAYAPVTAPVWNGRSRGGGQQITINFTGANGYLELWGPNMWGDIQFMKRYMAAVLISIADNPVNLRNVRVVLQIYASKNYGSAWSLMEATDIGALPITKGYHEVALCDLDLAKIPDLASGGGKRFQIMVVISGGPATSGNAVITLSGISTRMVN